MSEPKKIYEDLGVKDAPAYDMSVSPVLVDGGALELVPKLSRSSRERGMVLGRFWQPVPLPPGLPGPLAVLVCLDFLYRERSVHREVIGPGLDEARLLAVPSLTPFSTTSEFAGKAWEEARRYGRPVIYANGAEEGGTSVFVDEGRSEDHLRFPDCIGRLEAGDEGVVVSDVDLGVYPPGRSTRYRDGDESLAVPFACASFVYRSVDADVAYATVLDQLSDASSRDGDRDVESVLRVLHDAREALSHADASSSSAARRSRLSALMHELDRITQMEDVRRFTREVILPAEVLPLPELRRGLAAGAGNAVRSWRDEGVIGFGLDQIEVPCRNATVGDGTLTPRGRRALDAVIEQVGRPKTGRRTTSGPPAPAESDQPAGGGQLVPMGPFTAVPLPPLGKWTVEVASRPARVGAAVGGLAAGRIQLFAELQLLVAAESAAEPEEFAVLRALRADRESGSGREVPVPEIVVLLVRAGGVVRAILPDSKDLRAWEEVSLLVSPHYGISETEVVTGAERSERIAALLSRFAGARDRAAETLARCVDRTAGALCTHSGSRR